MTINRTPTLSVTETTPTRVNRELLDVAVAMQQALNTILTMLLEDDDDRDVWDASYCNALDRGSAAIEAATPLLVELGGLEAEPPDVPEVAGLDDDAGGNCDFTPAKAEVAMRTYADYYQEHAYVP